MMEKIFDRFTPANWIQIALLVFFGIGGYFKVEARLTKNEEAVSTLSKIVENVNVDGTKFGQADMIKNAQVLSQTSAISNSNQNRLAAIEARTDGMVTKVERIDANVQWIMEWVKVNSNKK